MKEQPIIAKFYNALQEKDFSTLKELYSKQVEFSDPVFQKLDYKKVVSMWEMLLEQKDSKLRITFRDVEVKEDIQKCTWEANYLFSKKRRPVRNVIRAQMMVKDGLITQHIDHFNFWRWSGMALGLPGYLLGWTPFLQNSVRKKANKSLQTYMTKKP